ncbi:DNA repair protein RecO, partial [Candidatus Pacearchaeota archaeon]|nr:DNA repair protein RecO [Candidatus Pacearchaeota archaeon]
MKGSETRGLIVKCTNYGESDRIVTVITEQLGKVRGIAKGARRSIKRFGGCLETFSLVSLLIREGKGLSYIGEGRVLKDFREIKKDIEKISYGSYMLEISDAVALDDGAQLEGLAPNSEAVGEPVSETVFSLLLDAIKSLAKSREPEAEARGFEVRLLAMAGYLPSFLN